MSGAILAALVAVLVFGACGAEDEGAGGSKGASLTNAQDEAVESAQSYLDLGSGFSKRGLIRQLSSAAGEGYSRADATAAVEQMDVDFKEQAVLSAQSYVDIQGFSRKALVEQLTSSAGDGYTKAEAEYAADKVGL